MQEGEGSGSQPILGSQEASGLQDAGHPQEAGKAVGPKNTKGAKILGVNAK